MPRCTLRAGLKAAIHDDAVRVAESAGGPVTAPLRHFLQLRAQWLGISGDHVASLARAGQAVLHLELSRCASCPQSYLCSTGILWKFSPHCHYGESVCFNCELVSGVLFLCKVCSSGKLV